MVEEARAFFLPMFPVLARSQNSLESSASELKNRVDLMQSLLRIPFPQFRRTFPVYALVGKLCVKDPTHISKMAETTGHNAPKGVIMECSRSSNAHHQE